MPLAHLPSTNSCTVQISSKITTYSEKLHLSVYPLMTAGKSMVPIRDMYVLYFIQMWGDGGAVGVPGCVEIVVETAYQDCVRYYLRNSTGLNNK
jgi:hypothetical protein